MKVMVLGATGMLGNAMFRLLTRDPALELHGTMRQASGVQYFNDTLSSRLITGIDVEDYDSLIKVFSDIEPDVVINCVGLVKQITEANDPLQALPINSLLPHRLAALCKLTHSRLIHISTDCVFSGKKGNYQETDVPDALDLYGRSKLLGEVDYPHAITLRTSIIGHELSSNRSLINWFLSEKKSVKGFTRALFSGLPTVELSRVVHEYVLPRPELRGLYHVAAQPISKFDLLKLVASTYNKSIDIIPNDTLAIDRSLKADKFHKATGYIAPEWPKLIDMMYDFHNCKGRLNV